MHSLYILFHIYFLDYIMFYNIYTCGYPYIISYRHTFDHFCTGIVFGYFNI